MPFDGGSVWASLDDLFNLLTAFDAVYVSSASGVSIIVPLIFEGYTIYTPSDRINLCTGNLPLLYASPVLASAHNKGLRTGTKGRIVGPNKGT